MSGDSMSIWFVSIKRVTFAREDLKRSYDLPQYCIEINKSIQSLYRFQITLTAYYKNIINIMWSEPEAKQKRVKWKCARGL
jgi:hypothetical protein